MRLKIFGVARLIRAIFQLIGRNSYLSKRGFWTSFLVEPGEHLKPGCVPWFSYPAIDFLDRIPLSGKNVFEYGSGGSTFYFQAKGARVHSVDHNEQWAIVVNRMGGNCIYCPANDAYVKSLHTVDVEQFDLILVDGISRDECAEEALLKLRSGGIVVLDDYHRYDEHFLNGYGSSFGSVMYFQGLGPFSVRTQRTAVFSNFSPPGRNVDNEL